MFLLNILLLVGFVQAAPQFERKPIKVNGKTITVEIADNDERREYGLMNRRTMPADEGMLFIFEGEQKLTFWMKDTLLPLSIGYYDKNRKLVDKQEMVPAIPMALKPTLYPSAKNAMYALEMNKGWFNKINLGTRFEFVKPANTDAPANIQGSPRRKHPDATSPKAGKPSH